MKTKLIITLLIISQGLVGCNPGKTPESSVKNYLSLMQKGNDAYTDYVCTRQKSEPHVKQFLEGMSSFEIQDISDNPEADYPSYVVQVIGTKNGEEFLFNLVAHETEPLYQNVRASLAKINSIGVQADAVIEQSRAFTGVGSDRSDEVEGQNSLTPPERSEYSSKEFCVTGKVLI
ncbi:hypothetical protein Lepto7375DRAFT_0573 [Leptolyngbya sp. PCC 7375]|nr:hypothetical protein Lepto7375DRAFT_0573 [Leptolyngbya sp. PCC 7375]